jgi:anti-repressor protein
MNSMTVSQNTEIAALVPVSEGEIGGTSVRTVNARDLHAWLGVKSEFRNWIKNRITQFSFEQGVDFASGNFLPGNDADFGYTQQDAA